MTRNRTDQFDIRNDVNVSSKLNLFGRYSFSDTNLFKPAPKPGLAEAANNDTFGYALWRSHGLAVGATWILSPDMVADMRFGLARGDYSQEPPNTGSGCPEQLIGLKGAPKDESLCGGLPVIDLPGLNIRRTRSYYVGATVPDAPFLRLSRIARLESREPCGEIRRRVPACADRDTRREHSSWAIQLQRAFHWAEQ